MKTSDASDITIQVVYALPEEQQLLTVKLAAGTSARDALKDILQRQLVQLADSDAAIDTDLLPIGVFGESVEDSYRMRQGDRLEIYRPLTRDPKDRRRQIAEEAAAKKTSR